MSASPDDERNARGRAPLSGLLARAARNALDLVKAEIEDYKAGVLRKLKESAIAIAMFAVAGLLALFALGYLIFAVYEAFLIITPGWLAALITAAILLALVGMLAGLGASLLKRHGLPDAGAAIGRVRKNIGSAVSEARAGGPTTAEDDR